MKRPSASTAPAGWAWYCRQPDTARNAALTRLLAVQEVFARGCNGCTRTVAVIYAANRAGVSARTIWNWLRIVDGVQRDPCAQLLALCPRPRRRANDTLKFLSDANSMPATEELSA